MHGAGNDFVVVAGAPPARGSDASLVTALADRRRGIGADGVLFLEQLEDGSADLRMHFYNCDGGRAGLCLNGARCAALRAVQLGWARDTVRIRTEYNFVDAKVQATTNAGLVRLRLALPESDLRQVTLPEGSPNRQAWALNTGDPHLVVEVSAVADDGFEERARPLRWWTGPDQAGSNVHFVERGPESWTIRSFERGIEGETLACGSGCVSALLALGGGSEGSHARLLTRSGDEIRVAVHGGSLELEGPAVCVFTTDWAPDAPA